MTDEGRTVLMPRSRVPAGTQLNGIYRIDHPIAAGGMGEVYKGFNIQTGDPVAIKMIKSDLAENEAALQLFRKEASALHNLHHEAIVRYYIFTVDPQLNRAYLAMEYVDGISLKDLLVRGPLGVEQVRILQKRIASGLHAAHKMGIIHRDVSPDNVLLPSGSFDEAKILDFGIARSTKAGEQTVIGSGFAGKYNYVSPEQLGMFGGNVTGKSDIYSLGLVLAECLIGRAIDMGGSQVDVIDKRRMVPDLSGIDIRFRPLLTEMLSPHPDDRPESMAAVAEWEPSKKGAKKPKHQPGQPGTQESGGSGRAIMIAAAVAALLGLGGAGAFFGQGFFNNSTGSGQLAQEERLAQQARLAETTKRADDARRIADEQAALQQKRDAEAKEIAARAEEQRLAALRRQEEEQRASLLRKQAEDAAAAKLEADRKAAETRAAEAKRIEDEKKGAEARRIADAKAEAERKMAEARAAEAKRIEDAKQAAEAKRKQEEDERKRIAEAKAEADRKAAEVRIAEAKRIEDEKKAAEAKRKQEDDERKRVAESKRLDDERKAAEARAAETRRADDEKKAAEARRRQEEDERKRAAEAKRLDDEKKAAEARLREDDEKKAAQVAEAKRIEEDRQREEARQREADRLALEKRAKDDQALAQRLREEQEQAAARAVEEEKTRVAQEAAQARWDAELAAALARQGISPATGAAAVAGAAAIATTPAAPQQLALADPNARSAADPLTTRRGVQTELGRLGCYPGPADGAGSKLLDDSIRRYRTRSGVTGPVDPADAMLLQELQIQIPERGACQCLKGQTPAKNKCVAARPAPAPAARPAARPAPRPAPRVVERPAPRPAPRVAAPAPRPAPAPAAAARPAARPNIGGIGF